ncbi:phosphatidylethanolamine-binding PEBP protein [Rutstroemia sp. NJR-2017a BVV2]|nr:phosphatidylethanolamine-binding PEBP protein [Rutstroemia sp. NJR-2017a BVV2]
MYIPIFILTNFIMYTISSLLAVALAGGVSAFTPTGFEPASSNNLTVAYGKTLAINGRQILRADTAQPPTIGTTTKLTGTYTILMVDPDIPSSSGTGPTSQFLHWVQSDLVSSNTTTTISGQKVYTLVNTKNTTAFAAYLQPNPPNKAPTTHRYTQLLFNTTGGSASTALKSLQTAAKSRENFSTTDVVKSAGLVVLMGNSFDVAFADKGINSTGAGAGSSSGTSGGKGSGTSGGEGNGTATSNSTSTSTAGPVVSTGGAGMVNVRGSEWAALTAMGAAVMLL